VKKAAATSRITTDEHLRSFVLLEPFLAALADLNPGTFYDVDVDAETQEFKGCALVMPYVKSGLEHDLLRPIFGLDVAHMKLIELEDSITLKPMFLTMISSRTRDNRMVICGFAITFSECSSDISYLYRVMQAAGIELNEPRFIILSDRGTAERAFVDSELVSCFHFYCGIHLTRNLKANRWTDYLPLFWNARNAATRIQHHLCMEKIRSKCLPMYTYLSNADRWQLFLALESGVMLYDWKSDNIVEHIFSWCNTARFLNPFMFMKHVVTEVFTATNKHRSDIESICTVLHPQALQHFEVLTHI
jgi:hypothetical protein